MRRPFAICAAALIVLTASVAAGAGKARGKTALKEALAIYEARLSVPNESADLAWARATEWVSLISDMRLDVASDTVLQTYSSGDHASTDLACAVNRRKDAEETVITGYCSTRNAFDVRSGRRGTAMLNRYVMTGDPNCLDDGNSNRDALGCLVDCPAEPDPCTPRLPELIFPEADIVAAEGGCSVEQITAMAKAGLSDKQIKAACSGDG